MVALQRAGAVTFDYGNNIRRIASDRGVSDAFLIPGFVPEYIRPLFCRAAGPSGGWRFPAILKTSTHRRACACRLFPENEILTRWLRLARGRFDFQGMPARICWLGYGERARMGEAMNDMVTEGRLPRR